MPITDRNLQPQTLLKATYKGASYLAEVKSYQDEKHVTLEGLEPIDIQGRSWMSLSAAACDITGNSVNGWRFWSLATPPAGKTSDLSTETQIANEYAKNLEPLYIGDDLEATPLPPAKKRGKDVGAPPVDADELAGVKQPCAAEDPGFGKGGVFTADAKRTKTYNPIHRVANQRGLEEGETRMWCDGCMASFMTTEDPNVFKNAEATCPNGHRVDTMRMIQASGTDLRATMSATEEEA